MTVTITQAGFRPMPSIIRADTTRTLPNDTNLNAIFAAPTNGRLMLPTGAYLFRCLIAIDALAASSGNALLDFLGAGTATTGSWLWYAWGRDNSSLTAIAAVNGAFVLGNASPSPIVTAGTGTGLELVADGTFEVTSAGTIVPSIQLASAAAGVVQVGSYFMCERIGAASVASVGAWE